MSRTKTLPQQYNILIKEVISKYNSIRKENSDAEDYNTYKEIRSVYIPPDLYIYIKNNRICSMNKKTYFYIDSAENITFSKSWKYKQLKFDLEIGNPAYINITSIFYGLDRSLNDIK